MRTDLPGVGPPFAVMLSLGLDQPANITDERLGFRVHLSIRFDDLHERVQTRYRIAILVLSVREARQASEVPPIRSSRISPEPFGEGARCGRSLLLRQLLAVFHPGLIVAGRGLH